MDRLEKLVIQAFKPSEGRAPIGLRDFIADHYEEFAKFHSLVAQEIFKELEERCPHTPDDAFDWIKRMCPDCFQTIKSKYMEEKDERTD